VSFYSKLYGSASNAPGASSVFQPALVAGPEVSNGFCYSGGDTYSPSDFSDSGLASDTSAFNGMGFSDPSQADPSQLSDAITNDWVGGLPPQIGASAGPVDLGNPDVNGESGAGSGSSILSDIGSGLGALVSGLGSAIGLGGRGSPRASLPGAVFRGSVPPLLASRFGGYGNNPFQRSVSVPPFLPRQPPGLIAPQPGMPGFYSNQRYAGFGSPQTPVLPPGMNCGGYPVAPGSYTPFYATGGGFSPAFSPGIFSSVPSYGVTYG